VKVQGGTVDIDLRQFQGTFFEEAAEHVAEMETLLVRMDLAAPAPEALNAIFRAAHSIKGGSAMFGFADMTTLTHELESLLDRVRKGDLRLDRAMVDVLLKSIDMLREQLAFYSGAPGAAAVSIEPMCAEIQRFQTGAAVSAGTAGRAGSGDAAVPGEPRALAITLPAGRNATLPPDLVEQLRELGELEEMTTPRAGRAGRKRKAPAVRTWRLVTDASPEVVRTLFEFVMDASAVTIAPFDEPSAVAPAGVTDTGTSASANGSPDEAHTPARAGVPDDDVGYGFFQPLPGAAPDGGTRPAPPAAANASGPAAQERAAAAAESSIRVSVEKVDQLINLVGELVITQAMLAQSMATLDPVRHERLASGMADLERNTRDLQESVMSIRMLPIAFVFNRFPRLVRDLAARLGKQVQLMTQGENTELDKGLIERISDPLTHLVRNAIDHGIEGPGVREAAGKPAFGTITLRASHRGGNVLIEVGDDGAGLHRERILDKAHERGLAVHPAMTDAEVWNLIFEPGFSTADVVTDVSGRGVGMDVVRRNIGALGGSVEIESVRGIGTRMTVRLPLTLAIMDGMSVAVGSEVYILPLASILESLQVDDGQVRAIAGHGLVIDVRGEFLPVLSMHELFFNGAALGARASGTMVVVESDGARVALLVDELLGQHQVVVKSLEANYRKVPGISGATIMGDGRVALILDVAALTRLRRQQAHRILPSTTFTQPHTGSSRA
jgi:two-component system, chemotaxis family, sensor kinase CheA